MDKNSIAKVLIDIVQQDPLLTTKLFVPGASRYLVSRPRLTDRLNQSLACALTVISAPAGYGKTTLLSDWISGRLESRDRRLAKGETGKSLITNNQSPKLAWLSLDEGDNDPGRFLSYFIAALQTVQPGLGAEVLQKAQHEVLNGASGQSSGLNPQSSTESLLTALINEIAAIADGFVLILDDYHLINRQSIHDALTFLLDHLPPQVHLIIASRTQPPLPLARLRARGQLIELGTADLRFTPDEAAVFLNKVMSLGLSAIDIATLEARTEGWIAGLQMAALSMQDRQDLSGFIAAFSGSHRYILDYLAEEVLRRQPEPVQQFLLQTSILDRLYGPLCDAILSEGVGEQTSGGEKRPASIQNRKSQIANRNGQAMLEQIEQASLFINPLDDERRWYRYHPLFATFLREQLQRQVGTQEMARLHRRAAEWYEQNGLAAEAMSHALAAADVERAVRLAEKSGRTILRRSEMATLRHWLESLPAELVRRQPQLSLFQTWALVLTGQLDVVEARLSEFDLDQASDQTEIPGEMTAIRATVAYFRHDIPQAVALYRQAFEELPEENLFLRGAVAMSLATAYNLRRDIDQAKWAFAQAAAISETNDNIYAALIAFWNLAQLCVRQGQLQQAAEHYRQAIQLATQRADHGSVPPIVGRLYVGLAEVLYQWNDLDRATHCLLEGIKKGEHSGDVTTIMSGYLALARVRQAQGDMDEALIVLEQAAKLAREQDLTSWRVRLVAGQMKLWLSQGDLNMAARWAQQSFVPLASESIDDTAGYVEDLRQVERVAQARLQIAQAAVQGDRPDRALNLLTPLRQTAEASEHIGRVIEILILQALAYQAQNNVTSALGTLEEALSLAEPAGYIRLFVDEGPALAELLRQAASSGISPDYKAKLLAAFPDFVPPSQNQKSVSGNLLVEPLSEREIEVLRLIATGMSNRQIAEKLVLTEGTVKWHVNNLFGKLGVRRRTQAVARARQLNLL